MSTSSKPRRSRSSYPVADRNSELQELSVRAFQNVLPVSKFLFRSKLADDFGVDGMLELKIDSCVTNLCAQVQLKSVEEAKLNQDGTISLPVAVSNVNYLLNGQSPLYILFIASRNELRYLWAREESNRLDRKKPDWMQQETVSLRFKQVLTPAGVDRIHRRIRQEARLQRETHETLARSATSEQVVIGINLETLASTDPDEGYGLLLSIGITLVAAGHAADVLNMFRFISPSRSGEPRLRLVRAYAHYTQGRYIGALAEVSEALLQAERLSSDDQQFLVQIKDACDFQAGRIPLAEYQQRAQRHAREATGAFALAHRLESIRHRLYEQVDLEQRADTLGEIRTVVGDILSHLDAPAPSKLQAQVVLLYAEGSQITFELLRAVSIRQSRRAMGRGVGSELEQILRDKLLPWERDVNQALERAQEMGNPALIGDLLYTRTMMRAMQVSNLRFRNLGIAELTYPESLLTSMKEEAATTISMYKQMGSLEGELRASMLLADVCELSGENASAKRLAEDVLPRAKAMDYAALEARAQEHMSGQTQFKLVKARLDEALSKDDDFLHLDGSIPIEAAAKFMLQALGLPKERLPVLEREAESLRDIAGERVHWCRHIELLQDLRHTEHPATYYRTDPDRHCLCQKYRYESAIGFPDWRTVIKAFKETYCVGCPSREPKIPAPQQN